MKRRDDQRKNGSDADPASIVQIDEHNLDRECIRLPGDYLKFAFSVAEAKRDVDEMKRELDVIEADVAKAIRLAPADYDLEKVTESAIKEAVLCSSRYRKAQRMLIEAKHRSELQQAVVWALEHKKRMLMSLVELHGMGYFSTPKFSDKGRRAVEAMTQRDVRRRGIDD